MNKDDFEDSIDEDLKTRLDRLDDRAKETNNLAKILSGAFLGGALAIGWGSSLRWAAIMAMGGAILTLLCFKSK